MNAPLATIRTEAETGLAETFARARQHLPGGSSVAAARAAAFAAFSASGLPHRRMEAWKYTDLRRLMRDAKPLAAAPDALALAQAGTAGALLAGLGLRRLVVVNGTFVPELSDLADLEPGLGIRSMADALAADNAVLGHGLGDLVPVSEPALALNTALAGDGVVVTVAPGARIERPLHLAFIATGTTPVAMVTRSLAVVGADAKASIIETHEGPGGCDYQVNTALQLVLGDGGQLDHAKIIQEGGGALHLGTLLAHIGAKAVFNAFAFTLGGLVVRNQMFVQLAGEGTQAHISGASLLAGKQHGDTTLSIVHGAPGGQSREVFKSVVDDAARAVFQGKISVQQAAQKTDARMMARALLLSPDAEADAKPELEIFADDVQCGHGATTGTLDAQLKFYLQARGIPPKEAEALLIQAFVGEAMDGVAHEGLRAALETATEAWLAARN